MACILAKNLSFVDCRANTGLFNMDKTGAGYPESKQRSVQQRLVHVDALTISVRDRGS
jgi:hypothetical protein